MKNLLSFIVVFILNTGLINAQYLQDITLSDLAKIDLENSYEIQELGFSDSEKIPSRYSLEKFCVVSDQKNSSSCTGFAVSNGAMSIIYNVLNGITKSNQKHVNRFDPFYIYASVKDQNDMSCISNGGCDCGSHIHHALNIIELYGCKKLFLTPSLKCSSVLNKTNLRSLKKTTGHYSIDGYFNLFEYEEINNQWYKSISIEDMKFLLYNFNPVIAGISVNDTFGDLSKYNNKYSSTQDMIGSHAVTVIGYDDNKYGGAFKILNSYGLDWGDGGYFWMTYSDFVDQADCAYVIRKDKWDDWTQNIRTDHFYKGEFKNIKSRSWEGPHDTSGHFHGQGIITDKDFTAVGTYNHGQANGWWLYFGNPEAIDSWQGWMLFENGEYVKSEDFGFSTSTIESVDDLKEAFHIENMEFRLSDDVVSEDYFSEDFFENMRKKSAILIE